MCKQHLDVCLGTLEQRVVNEASGWSELIAKCKAADVDLVVLEATGGYERGLKQLAAIDREIDDHNRP